MFNDVRKITDPYPEEDGLLSARSHLDKHIIISNRALNRSRKVRSNKLIGAYEYNNKKVWLYGCEALEFKDNTTRITNNCYVISPREPDFPLTLYVELDKGDTNYKQIVIDSMRIQF